MMSVLFWIVFGLNAFIVFHAMIGYPLLLRVVDKIKKAPPNTQNKEYHPSVSYMIVAHNEERVIKGKLENALSLEYPKEKMQIIVASDNSTDHTNEIVKAFINEHPDSLIVLYCTQEHKGKTNAQNEARRKATGEILVMTDANTMIKPNAIIELVSYFSNDTVAYVCGKLEYSNSQDNSTSQSESTYWDLDLCMRDIESRIWTITAGNGALYACRTNEYIDFNPISCHDSIMPFMYSKQGKRALFNPNAIAVEKAGETNEDEYKRKVRMNRDLFDMLGWGVSVLNIFKYKWFGLFYFGHRTCRYLLWLAHLLLLISCIGIGVTSSWIGWTLALAQVMFFFISVFALMGKSNGSIFRMIGYYGMTVFAQWHAVFNILTGKAKPVWEKAESTR